MGAEVMSGRTDWAENWVQHLAVRVTGFLCRRGWYGPSGWLLNKVGVPHYDGIPLFRSANATYLRDVKPPLRDYYKERK